MTEATNIPFNRPSLAGGEHRYIDEALASGKLSGNGQFADRCAQWLERHTGATKALITPSCTAALEMSGILAELTPGDEVIVPDFAFVSTANAFVLRGAVPVFVDIDPRTLNIDPAAIEQAISERTRAIVVIHYGGVACNMDRILAIARRHELTVIEDAAHAIEATYNGRPLGSLGDLATFSFHETKNVQCGEGGALLINDPQLVEHAEIIQEKGTDRSQFFRGAVDKYTWRDTGSSYLLSEVASAFLWAQLEHAPRITAERRDVWQHYFEAFEPLEKDELLSRPYVPAGCVHSGHLFYVLLPTVEQRDAVLGALHQRGVHAVFHYLPLHESPGGRRYGRLPRPAPVSRDASSRLLRLPLWAGLGLERTEAVVEAVYAAVRGQRSRAGRGIAPPTSSPIRAPA
ncbi:MAG: dTDP-4-amino-4,6-dideoxygalactose transaminase [Solirubrobacterales bacterium]|nr:dTDP-4-amino-4,6-dideoxygalactose transaminase [Solirubrobacterales bacterium]